MFQHPDLVCTFCALPMFTHALAWLKESTPACVGMNRVQLWRDQNICDFLRNWWNDLGKYFYVTFNKAYFIGVSISVHCLMKKSLIRSEAWLKEWHALLQYIKEAARPEELFKTLVYKIEFCLGFESYILWAFRVSSWCMFRTVLWVVILCTTPKLLSKELGRLWTASKLLSKVASCYFWG